MPSFNGRVSGYQKEIEAAFRGEDVGAPAQEKAADIVNDLIF